MVANFHTTGLPIIPLKTHAPLVIDTDAPLTGALAF
jgi:hypothetical protein